MRIFEGGWDGPAGNYFYFLAVTGTMFVIGLLWWLLASLNRRKDH